MKILFDCDAIIDIWGKTEDFLASFSSFDVTLNKGFYPYVTATALMNINYVLSARKYMSKDEARKTLETLMSVFDTLDVTKSDCRQALASKMGDFEDALIAHSAKRHGIDFIITRNKRDFLQSPVAALTPEEFVRIYKPDYLEYEMAGI